jgi:alanyl-tRNA synthetase
MASRLYYSDPHSREFDATITSADLQAGRALVRLDRTLFYPTSGGQPFDTGTLDGFPVVDVYDDEADEDIVHVLDVSGERSGVSGSASTLQDRLPQRGRRVHGSIDWPRRFDHMQQHSGQHVLSAAFVHIFGVPTVSFHLGAETCTIDLSREIAPGQLAAAEDEANRIVWEDRPIAIRFASAEEAARLPLRKEPSRTGSLRLIDIEQFDLSACGGTHVARTGQIGLIAITAWERFKGGQRVEFQCGNRASRRLRQLRDTVASATALLSVPAEDLSSAIGRLQAEAREQRRAMTALQTALGRYRADELAASAEATAAGPAVLSVVDADAGVLKTLATAIVSRGGLLAVLVSKAAPALVVVCSSAETGAASNEILAMLVAKFGGRGGGRRDLAQAGGLDAEPQAILDEARRILFTSGTRPA